MNKHAGGEFGVFLFEEADGKELLDVLCTKLAVGVEEGFPKN